MEAFSERLLREHQPAWQAMQQHPFVTDIEQDRLPTVVFNRYLVFEGNFVATAIAIFALGVSKAPGIQQQRWLIGVLNALVDIQIAWFEQVLSARQIDPAEYPDDLPGVRRFRDGMLRTAHEGSYEQIVTLMFGAEWMYYFWCRRASEHYQSDADLRRWVEMHAEDEFYQQALWLKNELDRCAMALSENEKQALSALYGEVLQWEIDFSITRRTRSSREVKNRRRRKRRLLKYCSGRPPLIRAMSLQPLCDEGAIISPHSGYERSPYDQWMKVRNPPAVFHGVLFLRFALEQAGVRWLLY